MASTPELTLMGFLGMGPMRQVIRRRLFGGPYLRFADYTQVSGFLYEYGALLGRAKRNKLMLLGKMFSEPGRERDAVEFLQRLAAERYDKYHNTYGEDPTSFGVLIMDAEYEKVGLPLSSTFERARKDPGFAKAMEKIVNEKMPLAKVEPFIKKLGLEGVGFGSLFPELTEAMFRGSYENIDMGKWAEGRRYGLGIPETPQVITLEEQEQTVLSMVAVYAGEYFPELVKPLGLTSILRQAKAGPEEAGRV